jgi:hypothetical protein
VAKAQLASLITAPNDQVLSVLNQHKVAVLNSEDLLWLWLTILVLRIYRLLVLKLSDTGGLLDDDFIAGLDVPCALAVIVPTPNKCLPFARAGKCMGGSDFQRHDWVIGVHLVPEELHPLPSPGSSVHFLKIRNDMEVSHSNENTNLLQ